MTITTALADFAWKAQSNHATAVVPTLKLGDNEGLTGIKLDNTPMRQGRFGQRTPKSFSYGTNKATFSAEWTLSIPWFLALLFGKTPVKTGSSAPFTYKLEKSNKPVPFTTQFRSQGTGVLSLWFIGCLISNFTLKCAVDENAQCTAEVVCGNVALSDDVQSQSSSDGGYTSSRFAKFTEDTNTYFPYTFINGALKTKKATGDALAAPGLVQSIDFSIATGQEQRYGMGSPNAQRGVAKKLEYTGTMVVDFDNKELYQKVLDRTEEAEIELTFSNGKTGANLQEIIFTLTGISYKDTSADERDVDVIEMTTMFEARECVVTVKNKYAAWVA